MWRKSDHEENLVDEEIYGAAKIEIQNIVQNDSLHTSRKIIGIERSSDLEKISEQHTRGPATTALGLSQPALALRTEVLVYMYCALALSRYFAFSLFDAISTFI